MSNNLAVNHGGYLVDDRTFQYANTAIKVVSVVISMLILLVSRYAFVFFVAAMIPTIVAVAVDRNTHRCASATICSFNLMGALPYIVQLWQSTAINIVAKYIIADVMTWIVVYGVSVVGILLYLAIPMVIGRITVLKAQMRVRNLQNKIDDTATAWGIIVDDILAKESSEVEDKIDDHVSFFDMVTQGEEVNQASQKD